MKTMIASCRLLRENGDVLSQLSVEIGAPYQKGDMWYCDWDIKPIISPAPLPAESTCSMHVLACALTAISSYLHARQKHGDRFFIKEGAASDELIDLDAFFPSLQIGNSRSQK